MSVKTELQKLTSVEEKLLNNLVDKGQRETKPKRMEDIIQYEGLEDLTKNSGEKEIYKALKSLTSKGFLVEKNYDSGLFCPRCNSLHIFSRYNCPQCQSINVHKVQLIEHLYCGYIGNRSEFETNDGLVCPKCKTAIGDFFEAQSKSQTDKSKALRIIGSSYACDKCGSKFERPSITHTCERCSANFTHREANYEKLPSYELTEKVEELAPNRFVMDALRHVETMLSEKGYAVELQAKLTGKSGVDQSFDLIARKGTDLLLFDVSPWGSQNDLISLLGKKMDIDSKSIILLDLAGNPNLASLGKPYNILVLDGRDDQYISKLWLALSEAGKEEHDKGRVTLRRRGI